MIPSNHKTPILLTQKSKERTVVKIANSSATYNRTSSSSSLTANNLINITENNPNIFSDIAASTSAAKSQEEQESLIDSSTNANMLSFYSTSSNAVLSNSSTQSNMNQEFQTNSNYFSNSISGSKDTVNEGSFLIDDFIKFIIFLKILIYKKKS